MTKTTAYLRTPPPVHSLPVRGKAERLPIKRLFFVGRSHRGHAMEMGRTVDKCVRRGALELAGGGQVRQKSDVAKLIWNFPELIADLSKYHHLQPGDLIFTGTPEGVGPVVAGERIDGRIEGMCSIVLHVGAAE